MDEAESATREHTEFNKYFGKIIENPNSDNCREFRNKLCRLLYVIRSNIAHGSKQNYQGSQRNEKISSVAYSVLLQICNLILDNGLYKIAAYGDLRRGQRLFSPLIEANNGHFLCSAFIDGQLLEVSNTSLFSSEVDNSKVKVDILEIPGNEALTQIDIVECVTRFLVPYYDLHAELAGFAWVYSQAQSFRNPKGPTFASDRHYEIKGKALAFLYSLPTIKLKFMNYTATNISNPKMFGNLTISNGNSLYFKKGELNSSLTSPHATELITFLEEIEHKLSDI